MASSDDHMGRADMNSAMREYLQQFYSVTNPDVQTLIERFLKDFTNAAITSQMKTDMVLRWQYLIKCAKGQETT